MELNAMNRKRAMSKPHDQAIVGLGRHRKLLRQARPFDHQRMVARGLESPVDAAEYPVAGVLDLGELAVNLDRCAHDVAAECLSDRLMTQADAEHRHGLRRLGDKFEADTGIVRRAGPRRQYNGVWI